MIDFKQIVISLLVTVLSLLSPPHGVAAGEKVEKAHRESTEVNKDKPAAPASADTNEEARGIPNHMPVYKPPLRGTPGGRVAAGMRGEGDSSLVVSALVPDHIGLTTREQPSLYWFLSKSTNYPVELTVIEAQAEKPIVEKRITSAIHPGIQCVRLADYGVQLKSGIVYQWFVAIVTDHEQRSKDIVVGGEITRIDPQGELTSKLAKSSKEITPGIYAEAGLWYDALSAVSECIDAGPDRAAFTRQRASLLQQVGLSEVAKYEMNR